jgi:molybdopterin-guanine dinucleotide biosynthesis protein A
VSIYGVVVAGGTSSRFGRNKLVEVVDGRELRQHSISAATQVCDRVVVVGFEVESAAPRVSVIREEPTGSGPFSAVAAGVAYLAPAEGDVVLVLAGDLRDPAGAVPELLTALEQSTADASVLVDQHHRRQPLFAVYRAKPLLTLFAMTDPVDRPAMQLLDGLTVVELSDTGGWSHDIDTPADLDIS